MLAHTDFFVSERDLLFFGKKQRCRPQIIRNTPFTSVPVSVKCVFVTAPTGEKEVPLDAFASRGMVHRARGQKGKRWAAEREFLATERLSPPPIFSLSPSLGGVHHSAADVRRLRNLHLFPLPHSTPCTIPQANAVSERNLPPVHNLLITF